MKGSAEPSDAATVLVPKVGNFVDSVPVTIGPNFLHLFSEQMYSSPNKAFEELVSNSWDAEARVVYVEVPQDLDSPDAAVGVLDDGESMDIAGMKQLWAIADSKKRESSPKNRPPIGKFGIGKLSTYVLARELTHVCRSPDGKTRVITMDYGEISQGSAKALHTTGVSLDVRELTEDDLEKLLKTFSGGKKILDLIEREVPVPEVADDSDEYGGPSVETPKPSGTWTLAIMNALKPEGKKMQSGVIRRMLRFALPLKSSITIVFNGEPLESMKVDAAIDRVWTLGRSPHLLDEVTVGEDDKHAVTPSSSPYSHLVLKDFPGAITGTVTLFEQPISKGKSADEIGVSHGFSISVKGRVINLRDPYFGLTNLSHSVWSRFRAAIRADGLDEALLSHRETVASDESLRLFRAFLFAIFNKVRAYYDSQLRSGVLDVGRILANGWSAVPLEPLHRAVSDGLLGTPDALPTFIDAADASAMGDLTKARDTWDSDVLSQPEGVLRGVTLEPRDTDAPLVQYRISRRDVVVNASHPFTREHAATPEQQHLLRNAAVVDVLTEAFMTSELSLPAATVRDIAEYRDRTLRVIALATRKTGSQISETLLGVTGHVKGLETIVGDALEHLGFDVGRLGQSGEPEGVAIAPIPAGPDDTARSYSFTYDAKSSKDGRVAAKDMNMGGLLRHREDHKTEFTLVVAPNYAQGAIEQECSTHKITPLRARDLARLLNVVSATGPMNLESFRTLFDRHTPEEAEKWVAEYEASVTSKPRLSLNLFFSALKKLGFKGPNAISSESVARAISELPEAGGYHPPRSMVETLAQGLQVFVPNLVNYVNRDIYLSTSPEKVREAVLEQISRFPSDYKAAWEISGSQKKKAIPMKPASVKPKSAHRRSKRRRR